MKLYVIVDSELSPGLKAAQGIHAVAKFAEKHPDVYWDWYINSNNIVVLESSEIVRMALTMQLSGYRSVHFREPDLDNAITAVCVEPKARKALSTLRLAS